MNQASLKLISHYLCPYVQRARIVMTEKAIPQEREFINLSAKPDWFRALSPTGKVPVLLVNDTPLFESAAIVEYLDETTSGALHPADPLDRARHRAWMEYASTTLNAIASFYDAPEQARFDASLATLVARFSTLNSVLGDGPFFGGAEFSLVDAAFAPVFRYVDVFDEIADFGLFTTAPRVRQWWTALRERPSVRAAVVDDYARRLTVFLRSRDSELARRMHKRAA